MCRYAVENQWNSFLPLSMLFPKVQKANNCFTIRSSPASTATSTTSTTTTAAAAATASSTPTTSRPSSRPSSTAPRWSTGGTATHRTSVPAETTGPEKNRRAGIRPARRRSAGDVGVLLARRHGGLVLGCRHGLDGAAMVRVDGWTCRGRSGGGCWRGAGRFGGFYRVGVGGGPIAEAHFHRWECLELLGDEPGGEFGGLEMVFWIPFFVVCGVTKIRDLTWPKSRVRLSGHRGKKLILTASRGGEGPNI